MLTAAANYANHSPIGGGFMGGHVYQDRKTGHWFIQIQWQKKTEKFFTYEYQGHWFPFEAKKHAEKILSVIQDKIDNKAFNLKNQKISKGVIIFFLIDNLLICKLLREHESQDYTNRM